MPPTEIRFYRNPHLKEVELRYSQYRQHAFEKHAHDTYSIGFIKSGQTHFLHTKSAYLLGEGDLALINPDEIHACNPQPDSELMYYMLYIQPDFLHNLFIQLRGQAQNPPFFTHPVIQHPPLYQELKALFQTMLEGADLLEIEDRLYSALYGVIFNYTDGNAQPEPQSLPTALAKGCDYLHAHLSENISLHTLAEYCNLSPFHFLRSFCEQYGLPPHAYHLQLRIQEARHRLANGENAAQVAVTLGFSDQSHLIRKFKELVGATPGQYQNNSFPVN
jgi:AraC-like DNA-binding protein